MVRPDDEPGPLDDRTQHKERPNDREALFIRHAVVLLGPRDRTAPVTNRLVRLVRLFLRQDATHLVIAGVRVQHVGPCTLRECQDRRACEPPLDLLKSVLLNLRERRKWVRHRRTCEGRQGSGHLCVVLHKPAVHVAHPEEAP